MSEDTETNLLQQKLNERAATKLKGEVNAAVVQLEQLLHQLEWNDKRIFTLPPGAVTDGVVCPFTVTRAIGELLKEKLLPKYCKVETDEFLEQIRQVRSLAQE